MSALEMDVIPFTRPYLTGREKVYVEQAVDNGLLSGDGAFTKTVENVIRDLTGAHRVLLTGSCTSALEMCGILLDLGPGDEVIVPSFAFVSTANAFVLRGATPVFVDCRPDTLNLDETLVEAAITERTKAIVALHYAGVACAMDELQRIARRHGLVVIEDNAHGLGGHHGGRPLGSFGALAAQSFHATKNVQCGEGGALVVNDIALAERAEILREKGTNRSQFCRGDVDKYTWVDLGSSFLLSELLAAFLSAQIEQIHEIHRARHRVWSGYHRRLARWAMEQGVSTPTVPAGSEHTAHLYYLVLPNAADQQRLLEHLRDHGVQGAFHYQPLHTSTGGLRYGRMAPGGCPVTERVAARLVRLPVHTMLTGPEADRVVAAVESFGVSA